MDWFPFLGLFCLLALQMRAANADCCAEAKVVKYKVLNGACGVVSGQRSNDGNCVIEICGDGRPLRGTFCGRRSCNLFGCDCDNGCLSGNWENTLVSNANNYKVEILEVSWKNLSPFRAPSQSVWDLGASIFKGKK